MLSIHFNKQSATALRAAMQYACQRMAFLQKKRNGIALFLSGGSVIPGYHALAEYIEELKNAEHITLLLADERWSADQNHADSNARQIEEQTQLFSRAEACGARVLLPMRGGSLEDDARIYNGRVAEALETHACIGIFGVGADSHTAGILPALPKQDFENAFAQFLWYAPLRYPIAQNAERLTLTPHVIGRMHEGIVYACGETKEEALENLLQKPATEWPRYPAVLLRQISKMNIFTDQTI